MKQRRITTLTAFLFLFPFGVCAPAPAPDQARPAPPPWTWEEFASDPVYADLHNDRSFFLTARGIPWKECARVQLCATSYGRSNSFFSLWRPPLPIRGGKPWGLSPGQVRFLNSISHFDYLKLAIKDLKQTGLPVSGDPALIGSGQPSLLMGVEGAFLLSRGPGEPSVKELEETLDYLKEQGVVTIGLVWSNDNEYAGTATQARKGLTKKGRVLVRLLIERGFVVDLSHASDQTVFDLYNLTGGRMPLFFSHSSARTLCADPRNVSDEILKLVKKTGGLVGVNFHSRYLTCSEKATLNDVADHILHIHAVSGPDRVALGSDFDGLINLPDGLKKPQNLSDLAVLLRKRNVSRVIIEKIFYGNVRNFLYDWSRIKKN